MHPLNYLTTSLQLTINECFSSEYSTEDSNLLISDREGSILLLHEYWARYTAASSSVGGTNISGSDREVVDLTG